MSESKKTGSIQVLPEHVARKIAAGEVIERPQSALRELLDNAIDAGASEINVWLEEGGTGAIIIQDNGSGMNEADLALCHLPHATSKIRTESDLAAIRSLGFRGEALAAIAAVSHLEIISGTSDSQTTLKVDGGIQNFLGPSAAKPGTRIKVSSLFYNLPARRQFMKRAATEYSLCQSTLLEKAMCFPSIHFRLHHNEELRLNLPACLGTDAHKQRAWQCYGKEMGDKVFFHEIAGSTDGARLSLLLANPDLYRHDRKYIHIFINNRRIQDYGLMQAIEYGFAAYLPGGRFPLAFAWLDVDPELLDVNIHPAKREVKLHRHAEIHHRLVELVQKHLVNINVQLQVRNPEFSQNILLPTQALPPRPQYNPSVFDRPITQPVVSSRPLALTASSLISSNQSPIEQVELDSVRYLGQIFGCFLAYVHREELVLLDMHAAHERILFEAYLADTRGQDLLIPREIEVSETGRLWLEREQVQLRDLGIKVRPEGQDHWVLEACPVWMTSHDADFESFLAQPYGAAHESMRSVAAQLACRAAVKDGDTLDTHRAMAIIRQAEALLDPRCPHGRPIWYKLERQELFTLIGRLV